ncbi:MAG: LytTR family DNA-binding domain-containing protein [Candidatus Eiseniibacteriota bacterium]|jgi:two-component system LytT family response regulator/two-component system response regulator LytT
MHSRPDETPRAEDLVPRPIRAMVIDDEPLAREELVHLLAGIEGIELVGEAANGIEALEMIQGERPDLAFVDIQMPGLDGFGLIKAVQQAGVAPYVVFVTAYDEYALRAFEVSATDYLLKPVERRRLEQAVDRVKELITHQDATAARLERLIGALGSRGEYLRRIPVRRDERLGLIDVDAILYAYIADGTVFAVTATATEVTGYRTMEELESDLDPETFMRVHRSYLANLNKVQEIIPWFSGTYRLKMEGAAEDSEIPLSRAQAKRLRKILKW